MTLSSGYKIFWLVLASLLLQSCAITEQAQSDTNADAAVTDKRQYMCMSKIYLSDMTKGFLLPVDESNQSSGDIQAGKMLDKAVQETFWTDSAAALSGRALPVVTLGFDGGTGVQTSKGKYFAQISLQFQIFKPTGQSYMDLAVGQSSAPASGQAASTKAIDAAIKQALRRLENILVNAEVCRRVQ